jgi:uncharacterized tellurite resistance protein B-like protein
METHMFDALQDAEVITPKPQELDAMAEIYVRVVQEAHALSRFTSTWTKCLSQKERLSPPRAC